MMFEFEDFLKQIAKQGLVIDAQDPQGVSAAALGFYGRLFAAGNFAHRENQTHGCPFFGCALDFDRAFMAFHRAVNHGQPEA